MLSSAELFRRRLTELRLKKSLSEYQMSLALGQSKGYIQQISSGRSLPSMQRFFDICDYLNVTPLEFFDTENRDPALSRELLSAIRGMSEEEIELLISVAKHFQSSE